MFSRSFYTGFGSSAAEHALWVKYHGGKANTLRRENVSGSVDENAKKEEIELDALPASARDFVRDQKRRSRKTAVHIHRVPSFTVDRCANYRLFGSPNEQALGLPPHGSRYVIPSGVAVVNSVRFCGELILTVFHNCRT